MIALELCFCFCFSFLVSVWGCDLVSGGSWSGRILTWVCPASDCWSPISDQWRPPCHPGTPCPAWTPPPPPPPAASPWSPSSRGSCVLCWVRAESATLQTWHQRTRLKSCSCLICCFHPTPPDLVYHWSLPELNSSTFNKIYFVKLTLTQACFLRPVVILLSEYHLWVLTSSLSALLSLPLPPVITTSFPLLINQSEISIYCLNQSEISIICFNQSEITSTNQKLVSFVSTNQRLAWYCVIQWEESIYLPCTVTVQCSDTEAGISSFSSFFQPLLGLLGSNTSTVFRDFFSFTPPVSTNQRWV